MLTFKVSILSIEAGVFRPMASSTILSFTIVSILSIEAGVFRLFGK